ncbi:Argonaute siRNA chaperone complex subunit Arb1-domain-containing protein [Ampelomyces quisqualis]|uniref:Argonaute siRNA chaperone complex subunit Arb1-domain-containing protein n=1 Tax=Ampelomyces quisqualis TaxID=50730 RepID=A0A6A5QWK8_AMPQU|nr:Argonaute siRNA chaperone complex subunit Arb1-domain-containing protein [Ampelomyces quisqualis]
MGTGTTQQNTEVAVPKGTREIADTTPAADMDHPEGAVIRRQVEFYFSDENLPTDLHLLKCCGGRQNEPVSISRICGFKKMRSYKPRGLVVAALRKSAFLDVSADGKTIKRKVPLQGKCALDPEYFEDDQDLAYDPRARKPAVFPVQQLPQKTVYPEGTSKNMLKPTGFEATYIEPPVKPEEAAEEEAMYDPDKSFVERIEIAIQRFKQKRRMHEMYALVFNKLMRFGGVESGPRMAQGLSAQEMKKMDAEEIAQALATHNVPWDRADEMKWVVDFEGLAKAFLSSWYPAHYGYAPNAVKNACQVPRSFYNYLRYHNVCPEYDAQLEKALKVCNLAEQELNKVHAAGLALPGDFNQSASVLLGGAQAGMYAGDKSWVEDMNEVGIRDEEARIKFNTGVAIMGSDEQYDMLEANQLKILQQITTGLEVVNIQPPTKSTKELYQKQSKVIEDKLSRLDPLGKLICETWYTDDYDEWDLPKDKYPNGKPQRAGAGQAYEFWVEESVLEECFVGLRMDANILKLEGGITILDEVHESMCSFFTWLPNELWMDRKPKEVRWLKKGLPEDDDEADAGGGQQFDDE